LIFPARFSVLTVPLDSLAETRAMAEAAEAERVFKLVLRPIEMVPTAALAVSAVTEELAVRLVRLHLRYQTVLFPLFRELNSAELAESAVPVARAVRAVKADLEPMVKPQRSSLLSTTAVTVAMAVMVELAATAEPEEMARTQL
jgi:hypothetical protein